MTIIIQNISKNTSGVCRYVLRINQDAICEFDHLREDGLAVCLAKASQAAELDRLERMEEIYRLVQGC